MLFHVFTWPHTRTHKAVFSAQITTIIALAGSLYCPCSLVQHTHLPTREWVIFFVRCSRPTKTDRISIANRDHSDQVFPSNRTPCLRAFRHECHWLDLGFQQPRNISSPSKKIQCQVVGFLGENRPTRKPIFRSNPPGRVSSYVGRTTRKAMERVNLVSTRPGVIANKPVRLMDNTLNGFEKKL